MAQRFEVVLNPIGGTVIKSNLGHVQTLVTPVNQQGTEFITMDVGGYNWDNCTVTGEVSKCIGHAKWDDAALDTDDRFQNWFVLDDGRRKRMLSICNGKLFYHRSDGVGHQITGNPSVTFGKLFPVSMCQYGDYVLIASETHTPYKWRTGKTYATKLIRQGTEFKFKYIETFFNHIIGAYTDQESGNIDIRYTEALPSLRDLYFPAANQLYKPDADLGITGIKRMGNNACLLYGAKSIHSIDYTPDYTPEFSVNPQSTELGTVSAASIIDRGTSHIFFDQNKGFVEYAGGKSFTVISDAIEPLIATINPAYYQSITGYYLPRSPEVVWTVPLYGANLPNALLYYHTGAQRWRRESRKVTALIADRQWDKYTWEDFIAQIGGTGALWNWCSTDLNESSWENGGYEWEDDGGYVWETEEAKGRWTDYATQSDMIIFGNNTGYPYTMTGDSFDGDDFKAYRVEPVLSAPSAKRTKRIQEIHVVSPEVGDYSIDFYWRGGISHQACEAASWEEIGSVSLAETDISAIYPDKAAVFHQLKWGTNRQSESFRVSQIILKGISY